MFSLRVCKKSRLVFGLAIALLWSGVDGQMTSFAQRGSDGVCYYTINQTSDGVLRVVDVLIDEADFTEQKLHRLMNQFREKYSELNMLVNLFSKLEQYRDSQNGDVIVQQPRRLRASYAGGILIFQGANQVIRYRTPGSELHTIVEKGVDPFKQD